MRSSPSVTTLQALAWIAWLAAPAALAQEKPKEPEAKPAVKVTAGPEGFAIQTDGGDFKLQLRGLVQLDGRFFPSDADKLATDTFLARRARPILTGSVGKYVEFNLTPDFGGGTAVIQDAYFDVRVKPAARFRLGKFKPPIGIEHLQADPVLPFVERAFAASLVPNRDVGAQLSGDLAAGVVSYAVGVFNGTTDGASLDLDANDGKDVVGRLVLTPFKKSASALKGLSLGIGATAGKQSGVPSAYRTNGQVPFFSYVTGVVAEGDRSRISPELSFFGGPVGLVAEYAASKSGLKKTVTSQRHSIEARGWMATASVFLTGDSSAFAGPKVRKPLDPAKGQWGALQLVARVNGFGIEQEAFDLGLADLTKSARKATAWGVGLNWYPNSNLKQMLTYERTRFTGGSAAGDRRSENALFLRSQLSF